MKKSVHSKEQKVFQKLLRQVRQEANFTQLELAKKLNRPQSFVSKIESGERRLDLPEIRQFCLAIGMSLSEFVGKFEELV